MWAEGKYGGSYPVMVVVIVMVVKVLMAIFYCPANKRAWDRIANLFL